MLSLEKYQHPVVFLSWKKSMEFCDMSNHPASFNIDRLLHLLYIQHFILLCNLISWSINFRIGCLSYIYTLDASILFSRMYEQINIGNKLPIKMITDQSSLICRMFLVFDFEFNFWNKKCQKFIFYKKIWLLTFKFLGSHLTFLLDFITWLL